LNHDVNLHGSEHTNADKELELINKELKEAQEHRHKCEIEERNAFKAYLKAQRSLQAAQRSFQYLAYLCPQGRHLHPDIELDSYKM